MPVDTAQAICRTIFFALIVLLTNTQVRAETPDCAAPSNMTVPRQTLVALKRGFNFTSWRRLGADSTALKQLRQRGFSHIRLPVDGEFLMPFFTNELEADSYLNDIGTTVRQLLSLGFAITIDMHPGGGFQKLHANTPERGYLMLVAAWQVLAKRFSGLPADRVFYELLNEPAPAPDVWWRQAGNLVKTVRSLAPDTTMIIGTGTYQRIDVLANTLPLADSNIVYAVHFYDPIVFTHQGQNWSPGDPLQDIKGVPFPADAGGDEIRALVTQLELAGNTRSADVLRNGLQVRWNEARVSREFDVAGQWMATYHRPVIVNEFGVLKWHARPKHRTGWLAAVRRAAERNCIGWTHWDYADGFGLAKHQNGNVVLDQQTLNALIPQD